MRNITTRSFTDEMCMFWKCCQKNWKNKIKRRQPFGTCAWLFSLLINLLIIISTWKALSIFFHEKMYNVLSTISRATKTHQTWNLILLYSYFYHCSVYVVLVVMWNWFVITTMIIDSETHALSLECCYDEYLPLFKMLKWKIPVALCFNVMLWHWSCSSNTNICTRHSSSDHKQWDIDASNVQF